MHPKKLREDALVSSAKAAQSLYLPLHTVYHGMVDHSKVDHSTVDHKHTVSRLEGTRKALVMVWGAR